MTARTDVTETAALAVVGASKRFGSTQALDHVDLRVAPASVHALVGANGSGKSTLIKALAGLHVLDAGSVTIHGVPIALHRVGEDARAAGLRFVHQDLALIPNLSIADNLGLSRGYASGVAGTIDWPAERAQSRTELESVGIHADPQTLVKHLGPVERTLLAVARALDQVDPSRNVLLLDEPTARLPQHDAARLIGQLQALRSRGLPIVYVSHRLEEIYELADAITVLRDGRMVFEGPLVDLSIQELRSLITGVRTNGSTAATEPSTPTTVAATSETPVLDMRDVESLRLRGISLAVRPGEVLGITGLIGSGRSELGRVVYGLQRYHRGEIRIDGRLAGAPRTGAHRSPVVGYTPQERKTGILSRLTVSENLVAASYDGLSDRFGLSRSRERAAAGDVIDVLRIKPPDPSKIIDLLSGGNQQKVVLGKWLRLPLRLIILDEPTQSIDIGAKADLMSAIRERARETGLAVLWLESDADELVKYADRILVMRAGAIVAEFPEPPFSSPEIVSACYVDSTNGVTA